MKKLCNIYDVEQNPGMIFYNRIQEMYWSSSKYHFQQYDLKIFCFLSFSIESL